MLSINEMILISRICFVGMILFLFFAVLLFFKLNIRKAWEIVSGKYLSGHSGKNLKLPSAKLSTKEMMNSGRLRDGDGLLQTDHETKLLQTDYETKLLQTSDETTVLRNGETVLLAEEASDENGLDIIVDITYVHTQIVL